MNVKNNNILIERACDSFENKQSNGHLLVLDADETPVFACVTLELPDRDNKRKVSNIPAGSHRARKHVSPKFGACVHIYDVPDRSEVLIHPANKVEQLLGCIAVGKFLTDLDGDGADDDISNSRDTMKDLMSCLPNEFIVSIIDKNI